MQPTVSERAGQTPSTDELWRWSAVQTAAAIKRKEISALEVTTSCLERIDTVNPHLNALVEVSADAAVEAARVADRMVAAGQALGPLHGVPTSTKINSDQKGLATTDGVVAWAKEIAPQDSPQVASLRQAGAIFLGRSNSPAFSYRWFSNNELHGSTLNPWDPTRTPGGSSGGASSSVASGMVAIGQGNDIGGSIRYPAYACGVVGLRPTVGRVPGYLGPRDGDNPVSVQTMAVNGPLARTVGDVRLGLAAMSGYHPFDTVSIPGAPAAEVRRPLKVGVVTRNGVFTSTPAVEGALRQAASWLGDAGYEVEDVELPMLEEAYRIWYLLCMEDFRLLMPLVEQIGDHGMKTAAANYYAVAAEWWGEKPSLADYINGYARRGTLIRQLQGLFESYSLFLLPVSAEQAFEQDADIASVESMRRVMAAQYSMMAIPLLGFPAMSVPTGVADGLPLGVQLLGRRFGEESLLDAGAAIEARAGVITPIDPAGA
ncbi:MAG TPA: amidase family protein [Solirubrobacteraceae bacterium]